MTALNDNQAAAIASADPNVEIASGKGKADENFPVGSWLIAAPLRRHVHAYYAFARNADDIADHATLAPDDKIRRLNVMEAVLAGTAADATAPSAARLRASLAETGVPAIHARELLIAFRQDAVQTRYEDWAALLNYCRYSAAPVGRYVLALHGEPAATWPASDALCASLQILNHLQDCGPDLRALDRCYIPQDMLAAAGASTDDIARGAATPGLRLVFDQMLAATAGLNHTALRLPGGVRSRRLRLETAIIGNLARRLTRRLQRQDPLAMRVKLSKPDIIAASLLALPKIA